MLMATWADIVRERSLEARNKKYHHSNWHYDDTFWKQVNGKAAALPGLRRFYSMVSTFVVREVIVEGERACALTRYSLQPPNGGPSFTSDVAEIFTVRNDKITSFAIYFDTAPYPK